MQKLVLTLVAFCAGSGLLAYQASGRLGDLGLNLFSESVGLLITVLIVDRLLKREAERRALPRQVCAYKEIRRLAQRMIGLYQLIYRAGNEGKSARDINDLFAESSYQSYMGKVSLDAPAPAFPSQTWLHFFCNQCADFRERSRQIADRYSVDLEPEVFGHIHTIYDSVWNPGELDAAVTVSRRAGSTQFRTMSSLLQFPDEWFDTLSGIIAWLEKEELRLKAVGAVQDVSILAAMFPARD